MAEKKTTVAKPKGPTKKTLGQEQSALKLFNNMLNAIEVVTSGFIEENVRLIKKAPLSDVNKAYVVEQAKLVIEKAKTNPKIDLPKEWEELLELA